MRPGHIVMIAAAVLTLAAPVAYGEQRGERRAEPRAARPRGDNPPTGVAVRRNGPRDPGRRVDNRRNDRPRVTIVRPAPRVTVVRPPRVYSNHYYYPRGRYPYGYGSFGLGYFYYNPYGWSPGVSVSYNSGGYYGPGYYGGYYPGYVAPAYNGGYAVGELRLRVEPRHAEVYVDGYYAGQVDDYDGIAQSLKLEEGPYKIEIVAPGFEPLEFDVRILPGQKINYRGALLPRP